MWSMGGADWRSNLFPRRRKSNIMARVLIPCSNPDCDCDLPPSSKPAPYNLFLDDQAREEGMEDFRYPPQDTEDCVWKVATSSAEAMEIVCTYGFPSFMQLDCDLGMMDQPEEDRAPLSKMPIQVPDTAMRFVRWLYNKYPLHEPFWSIHSQNGEAAKNLESFLMDWKKSIEPYNSILCSPSKEDLAAVVEAGKNVEEISGGLDLIEDHGNISEACLHTPPGTTVACPTGCGCWCDACEATRKKEVE